MTSRLEKNECLWCGDKLIRIDHFPLCSKCEEKGRKLQYEYNHGRKPKWSRPIVMKYRGEMVPLKTIMKQKGML